jgi:hypothetical protein
MPTAADFQAWRDAYNAVAPDPAPRRVRGQDVGNGARIPRDGPASCDHCRCRPADLRRPQFAKMQPSAAGRIDLGLILGDVPRTPGLNLPKGSMPCSPIESGCPAPPTSTHNSPAGSSAPTTAHDEQPLRRSPGVRPRCKQVSQRRYLHAEGPVMHTRDCSERVPLIAHNGGTVRVLPRQSPSLTVTDPASPAWLPGTTHGMCTGRSFVPCVLSGHPRVASAQVERLAWPSRPQIRRFGTSSGPVALITVARVQPAMAMSARKTVRLM